MDSKLGHGEKYEISFRRHLFQSIEGVTYQEKRMRLISKFVAGHQDFNYFAGWSVKTVKSSTLQEVQKKTGEICG